MTMRFEGSYVALVTPMRDGAVDEDRLRALVDFQIDGGTDGLVPCGTTGESATLTHAEHKRVVEVVLAQARGRVPVLAGTGSNSTAEAVELTQHAARAGAAGALVITPYYNKPSPEGLYRHFAAVAAVGLPVVVYNVPSRTGVDLKPDTMERLAALPAVTGIKEATADMDRAQQILERCGDRFTVLSGDDMTCLPLWACGARGVISVTANVAPAPMAACWDLFAAGKLDEARAAHRALCPLHRAMFVETNPVPVKTALAMMGRCGDEVRPPLAPLTPASREALRQALGAAGLI